MVHHYFDRVDIILRIATLKSRSIPRTMPLEEQEDTVFPVNCLGNG